MLDYNIPVAQPLMGLNTAIGNEIDRNNEQARVAGLQQQRERLISEAQAAYRSGDLNALAEFSIANPELGAMATEQAQHKNERTKAVREQTMAEIVGGADPYEAVINGSQKIRREGGDPSDMLQLLDKSPQEIRQLTEVAMATQFPDSFKNVRSINDKNYEQASAKGMEGWSFNKDTGEYSLDPNYQSYLNSDAGRLSKKDMLTPKDVSGINDKITSLTKEAIAIKGAALDLEALSKDPTQPSVIAAIFKFMKALDPSSAVRENEVGMIEGAEGAVKGLQNMYNRLMGEGGMTKEGFREIVRTAQTLSNSASKATNNALIGYTEVVADNLTDKQLNNMRARSPEPFVIKPRPVPPGTVNDKGWGISIDPEGNRAFVNPADENDYEVIE